MSLNLRGNKTNLPTTDEAFDFGSLSQRWGSMYGKSLVAMAGNGTINAPIQGQTGSYDQPQFATMLGFVDDNSTVTADPSYGTVLMNASVFEWGTGNPNSLARASAGGNILNCNIGAYNASATVRTTIGGSSWGSMLSGYCYAGSSGSGTAKLDIVSARGAFLAGYSFINGTGDSEVVASGNGSFVQGRANCSSSGLSRIQGSASGSFAQGYAVQLTGGNSRILSNQAGAFAQGFVNTNNAGTNGADIDASNLGAFAQGYAFARNDGTVDITASGIGAMAHGVAWARGGIGKITASNVGATALGDCQGTTGTSQYITASGRGSLAIGSVNLASNTIAATQTNSFQFGIGTNATANSLQVDDGVQLYGDTGRIRFDGILDANSTTVTGTSHTAADEHVILVDDDTAGSTVTVTLPAAASSDGYIYYIKKLGSTANVVVDGNASENIDGVTTQTLSAQHESIGIICDGSNWHII